MTTLFRLPIRVRHASNLFTFPLSRCAPSRCAQLFVASRTVATASRRTYADALELLDTLQSNRAVRTTISDTSRDLNLDAIPEMLEWTRKAGYEATDFANRGLRCIHVAGTKGKGSVCVMTENILLQYRKADGVQDGLGKIGLYTSPHLVTVRERIRIDGSPISEVLFTKYFFELWDRFSRSASSSRDPLSLETKPGYFRYLTLLAFHTFLEEGVETAIVECGIGGEYDSTNILPPEAVTASAISSLGIDHTGMLGGTIDKIAWHKAGIMKHGVPAFTVKQCPEAQKIIDHRAGQKSVELTVVNRLQTDRLELGLQGDFQKDNASLAVAIAASHLKSLKVGNDLSPVETSKSPSLPKKFVQGLKTVTWQGRCEVRQEGNIEWFLDGAHTLESIEETAGWYSSKVREAYEKDNLPTATMLIFNQQEREGEELLRRLMTRLGTEDLGLSVHSANMFTYAAFCTNAPFKNSMSEKNLDLGIQDQLAQLYHSLDGNTLNVAYGTVEEAVELARRVFEGEEKAFVLVTGSLHLVGGLLKVLERPKSENQT